MPSQDHLLLSDRRHVLGLGLAGVAAPAMRMPGARAFAGESIATQLDALLDATASAYGTVGYSVAVLRRGRLVHLRHAGLADRDTGAPITDRSVYPIFSVSKLFLVVELLKAARRGVLDPSMSLGRIRDGLPDAWRRITLAQALAHVSGLPDYIPDFVAPTEEGALAAIRDKPLRFATGTRNDYNQTNMLFARQALEQAAGAPLTVLAASQFRAAGLRHTGYHTGYPRGAVRLPGLVSSYRPVPGRDGPPAPFALPSMPAYTFGSTGVFTTMADMVRWSQALLRGDLLPLETLRASWAPFAMPSGAAAWHTHGWEYYRHGDVTIVGHGGDVRLVWRHFFRAADPDDCATAIYFDNGGRSTFDRHRLVTLLADLVMPGAARATELREEALFRGLASGRWDAAIAGLKATTPPQLVEEIVNRVGYDAMQILDAETALPPFEWNVREFSRSPNAHDSLGEAYRATGRIDAARASYARALALDPGNARIKAIVGDLAPPSAAK
ncbi:MULTISPECIES: serine hydrolase [unclassified Sphingomonas]|nr:MULTISPECIES: serine hydrolase [unclassified Sphingomonas]